MLKEKFSKLKNLFNKTNNKEESNKTNELSSKKKIENLAVFLIILIITLLVINYIWNDDSKKNDGQTNDQHKVLAKSYSENSNRIIEDSTFDIKTELEDILSNIEGVGKVKVMITYASTSTTMPIYNEESTEENTEETDSEGGTRKVTQTDVKKEVIYEENDEGKTLITQKTTSPEIEGAIITAEGAESSEVKSNIIQAVGAVTGLPTHRIQVFKMNIN